MLVRKRSGIDRRSRKDRRTLLNINHWLRKGVERRSRKEQRSLFDRRAEWARVGKWSSVYIRDLKIAKFLT
jgi:hypothetical protein